MLTGLLVILSRPLQMHLLYQIWHRGNSQVQPSESKQTSAHLFKSKRILREASTRIIRLCPGTSWAASQTINRTWGPPNANLLISPHCHPLMNSCAKRRPQPQSLPGLVQLELWAPRSGQRHRRRWNPHRARRSTRINLQGTWLATGESCRNS